MLSFEVVGIVLPGSISRHSCLFEYYMYFFFSLALLCVLLILMYCSDTMLECMYIYMYLHTYLCDDCGGRGFGGSKSSKGLHPRCYPHVAQVKGLVNLLASQNPVHPSYVIVVNCHV